MIRVHLAQLTGHSENLLLAEQGLVEGGSNVAFDAGGRQLAYEYRRFDSGSEREIAFDSHEITAEQRAAYDSYWEAQTRVETEHAEVDRLRNWAHRHPARAGDHRAGGRFLPAGDFSLEELVVKLREWLRVAIDEDVVGYIGAFGGRTWLSSTVPDEVSGRAIAFDVHADSRAVGVADFLCFVRQCGGVSHVRARREGDRLILTAAKDGTQFTSGEYFYWSQNR